MTQHTPGPWVIREDRNFTPGGSLTIEWSKSDHAIIVAEVWTANDSFAGPRTQEPISRANARLIAKAPEMYALLQAVVYNPNLMARHKGDFCAGKLQCGICTAHALLREIEGERYEE